MILNVLSAVLLVCGFFFMTVGTIGLLRLPDTYTRLHATGKCDTMGSLLIILGCMLMVREPAPAAKLLAMAVFLWIVNPATAHMIARVAHATGVPMIERTRHVVREDPAKRSDSDAG